jgi:hypothetical protein
VWTVDSKVHQKVANQNEENEGDEDSAPSLQASRPGEAVAGKENDHDTMMIELGDWPVFTRTQRRKTSRDKNQSRSMTEEI